MTVPVLPLLTSLVILDPRVFRGLQVNLVTQETPDSLVILATLAVWVQSV